MRKEVSIWLKKARRDLEIAEYNLKGNMLEMEVFDASKEVLE